VVERRRLHEDEPVVLWRLEGNRLLRKFVPEVESDGSVIHKPSSVVRTLGLPYLTFVSPLTSSWPHLRCDVGLEEGEYK